VCIFPSGTVPLEVLREVLAGGLDLLEEEDVLLLGGHTIKGPEFAYGLAVTGLVHPDKILVNAGARVGDLLVLTKPLGTGVLATALKRGELAQHERMTMVASMAQTNRAASAACVEAGVHALTDVTGYGLLGHALEMAEASGVAIEIDADKVPLLPGAYEAARSGAIPAGLLANWQWVEPRVTLEAVEQTIANLLVDPQTSGGLLAAVPPAAVDSLVASCARGGVRAWIIGRVVAGLPGTALVRKGRGQ